MSKPPEKSLPVQLCEYLLPIERIPVYVCVCVNVVQCICELGNGRVCRDIYMYTWSGSARGGSSANKVFARIVDALVTSVFQWVSCIGISSLTTPFTKFPVFRGRYRLSVCPMYFGEWSGNGNGDILAVFLWRSIAGCQSSLKRDPIPYPATT